MAILVIWSFTASGLIAIILLDPTHPKECLKSSCLKCNAGRPQQQPGFRFSGQGCPVKVGGCGRCWGPRNAFAHRTPWCSQAPMSHQGRLLAQRKRLTTLQDHISRHQPVPPQAYPNMPFSKSAISPTVQTCRLKPWTESDCLCLT